MSSPFRRAGSIMHSSSATLYRLTQEIALRERVSEHFAKMLNSQQSGGEEKSDEMQQHSGSGGAHAAHPPESHQQGPQAADVRQSGIYQPWRLGKGPHRHQHDR